MTFAFNDPASIQLFDLLSCLLSQLSSDQNEVRNAAEEQLNKHWLVQQPGPLLAGLAHLTAHASDQHVRNFAPVLLRRIALKLAQETAYIDAVGPVPRQYVQEKLVYSLSNEAVLTIRNKVCDCVSQIAEYLLDKEVLWEELVLKCLEFSTSQNPELRRTCFLVVSGVPDLFVRHDPAALANLFNSGCHDQDLNVQLACLKASIYYLLHTDQATRDAMAAIVPVLLNIVPSVLNPEKEELAAECLGYFVELAEEYPKLFKPVIGNVITFMTQQMKNTALEDGTRQLCLELLLTLTENAPGMMRKNQQFGNTVIPIILEWMSELEDDEAWYKRDNLDDDDQDTNETAGEQAMDRLALYLGAKIVLPVSFSLIPALLSSNEWQKRHSGLRCISAIGEGCLKLMEAELSKVVDLVLPHLRDPHPRVRHAACNAIGQMCTDFAPTIQNLYHDRILASLIPVMDDPQFIRVASYGAAAMVNFSENAKKDSLVPYLDTIIPKLLNLMNSGVTFAQEQAITTLATVADSAGPSFKPFYGSIMPVLLNVLKGAITKELRSLRGKTMECASLIALAVGKETFVPNAQEFIQILQVTQQSITDPDDPQTSYLLSAWARVCKVLGTDFAPYLDIVLPPLIASAQLKPDVVAFEADEEIGEGYSEEDGWEMLHLSGKKIGIKTSVLEEKCTAVEMLLCYVQEMGALFHPYVQKIMEMILPLLKFYFHEGVRYAAASVIPLLLKSWIKAQYPQEQIFQLWHVVVSKLFDAMDGETDPQLVTQLYNTFTESHHLLGVASLTPELFNLFTIQTQQHLQKYYTRMNERQEMRNRPDYEPEDEEALQDNDYDDQNFLGELARAIQELFKTYRADFLPYFDQLLPAINAFLGSQEATARHWAICVYCDVLEFTGEASTRYAEHFVGAMAQGVRDASADVRQGACYGIGVAALTKLPFYANLCTAIPHLLALMNDPNARTEENILATENAVAAIAKILSTSAQPDHVFQAFFVALPLTEDEEEAPFVYRYLLHLIEQNHPVTKSTDKLVHIITEALIRPSLLEKVPAVTEHLVKSLSHILSQCDQDTRAKLWSGLAPETQSFLTSKGYI